MPHVAVRRLSFALLPAIVLGWAAGAEAVDSAVLTAVYGEGVKAFFGGRTAEAHQTLSQAIEAGSQDPRCFYFRGLSNLRLGRTAAAQLDFTKGAAIEAKDFDVFYNVSGSLERIQGSERLLLERYRADGRLAVQREIEKIRFEHYRRFNPGQGINGPATIDGTAPAADPGMPPSDAVPNPSDAPPSAPNPFGGSATPNPFGN